MSSAFLDLEGRAIPQEQVLGNGASAVVVLQDGLAIKTPLRWMWNPEREGKESAQTIRREQNVYRRLQPPDGDRCHGVVDCTGFSGNTIQLAHMKSGDLRANLVDHRPSREQQLSWFRHMASALGYIHGRRVLVADIATRNFLVDSDLSVKFCDFSEASLLDLDTDMETADDRGYNTRVDIGQLGAVIYEVVTGQKCEFDLHPDHLDGLACWPAREDLPSTENIWLGLVIDGCWADSRAFSAHSLAQALDMVDLQWIPPDLSQNRVDTLSWAIGFIQERPVTTLAFTFGTFTLIASWARQHSR